MTFQPSKYQEAIFAEIERGAGDLVVEACAGSGKTTTLVEACKRLEPGVSALFCAFNRSIANELGERLSGSGVQAQTLHSLGKQALDRQGDMPRTRVDKRKHYKLVDDYIRLYQPSLVRHKSEHRVYFTDEGRLVQQAMLDLLNFARLTLTDPTNEAALIEMCLHYEIDIDERALRALPKLLEWDQDRARESGEIDFTDMIWLPVQWQLPMPTFEWVFVDEAQDLNRCQLELVLKCRAEGGRMVFIGDRRQCVVAGTMIGNAPVEAFRKWDTVPSAAGRTSLRNAIVSDVFSRHVENCPVVTIRTKSGKELTTTAEHIHFAGYLHDKGEYTPYFTYLMYKESHGYRLGVTRKYRGNSYKGGRRLGFKTRTSQERADKLWLLEVSDTEPEARYWEAYYAAKYGLPTTTFLTVAGTAKTAGMALDQDALDRLYAELPTQDHAQQLMRDRWLHLEYPHHTPKCTTNDRRRNFTITLCADGRGKTILHKCEMGGNDPDDATYLQSIGVNVTANGKGTGWRVRMMSANLGDLYDLLSKIQQGMEVNVIQAAAFGNGTSLPFTPASHVLPGMMVFVKNGQQIELDEVVEVERHLYTGTVYDLNVEPTHNYAANGIITHNSIYGFAGADNRSIENIIDRIEAKVLPLSICYRCPTQVIELAQEVIPHIEPRPDAPPGTVVQLPEDKLPTTAKPGDMIVCRLTAPLISQCIEFIKAGIPARVEGRDIGKQLTQIVDKVTLRENFVWDDFLLFLNAHRLQQAKLLADKDADETQIISWHDRCDAVQACYESMAATSPDELKGKIESLFDEANPLIKLATIHRCKGLESDRVFIIAPEKLPLMVSGWQQEQEWNLRYVAVTRAMQELYIVGEPLAPGPYANGERPAPVEEVGPMVLYPQPPPPPELEPMVLFPEPPPDETYVYGMRNRPAMYGTCPVGFREVNFAHKDLCPNHGYVAYNRQLTPDELYKWEMFPASKNAYPFQVGDRVLVNDIDPATITRLAPCGRYDVRYDSTQDVEEAVAYRVLKPLDAISKVANPPDPQWAIKGSKPVPLVGQGAPAPAPPRPNATVREALDVIDQALAASLDSLPPDIPENVARGAVHLLRLILENSNE